MHCIMCLRQCCIINYIDDFIGMGMPNFTQKSFHFLHNLLKHPGLTVSHSKLIPPKTEAICLSVLIYTVTGTILVPSQKRMQIKHMITEWQLKTSAPNVSCKVFYIYISAAILPQCFYITRLNCCVPIMTTVFNTKFQTWFDHFLTHIN